MFFSSYNNIIVILTILLFISSMKIEISLTKLLDLATKPDTESIEEDDPLAHDEEGLLSSEIIRLRKFNATDHYVTTPDGYILNLVEAKNPLIMNSNDSTVSDDKEVILFIHGIFTSARDFIVNSINARPKDYTHINVCNYSAKQLHNLMKNDPARKTLVFTALNFGHHVWVLNRRGTIESRGHHLYRLNSTTTPLNDVERIQKLAKDISKEQRTNTASGLKSIIKYLTSGFGFRHIDTKESRKFWNYSLDEQARYDIPATIDYILKRTGRKNLTIIGHSIGSALPLMSMTMHPDLPAKINQAILWAPALNLGANQMYNPFYRLAEHYFQSYLGSYPSSNMLPIASFLPGLICSNKFTQNTICQLYYSMMDGDGGGKLEVKPGFLVTTQDVVSTKEYAQIIQFVLKGNTHYYDYRNKKKNIIAYGQPDPPRYNFTNVNLKKVSIWYGRTDSSVTTNAVDQTISELKGPVESHIVDIKKFNHMSFLYHKNVDELLIIPNLIKIENCKSLLNS